MLISTAALNSLRVGFKNDFSAGFDSVSANDEWWKLVADETNSEDASEVYRVQDTLFRMREWLGPRTLNNLVEKSITLVNKEYELTYALKVTDVEDDKFGNMASGIKSMGRAARLWPNDLVTLALSGAEAAVCYDGQFFFDTDHPCEDGTTQTNLHAGTSLTAANYVTRRAAMMTRKGFDGKPLNVRASHIVVPPELEITAKRIVEADLAGYLQNAASNAVDSNVLRGTTKVMVIPELSALSTTSWYLADLSKPIKPFVMQFRVRPEAPTVLNRPNDQGVFEEGLIKVGTRARGAAGYGLWQLIDKCNA